MHQTMTTSPALRRLAALAAALVLALLLAHTASALDQDQMEAKASKRMADCRGSGGTPGVWYNFDADGNIESMVVTCNGGTVGNWECAYLPSGEYCTRVLTRPDDPVAFPGGGTSKPDLPDQVGPQGDTVGGGTGNYVQTERDDRQP